MLTRNERATERRPSVRRAILNPLKRKVLWGLLLFLVLVIGGNGLARIVEGPPEAPAATGVRADAFPGPDMRAYATRFARAWLTYQPGREDELQAALEPMLAPELRSDAAVNLTTRSRPQRVVAAEVDREPVVLQRRAGRRGEEPSGRAVLTVAATLSTGDRRYVAVTVYRDDTGGLAVVAYPSLVGPPPPARLPSEPVPDPVTGPESAAITRLMDAFFPVYLAGGQVDSVFFAPGYTVPPLRQSFDDVSVVSVADGGGQPVGRLVLVQVRARDRATRTELNMLYRVVIGKTDRWLVLSIEGETR